MHTRLRRLTAWIALAAMLFGAVSPAVAGMLFTGRADVLARMLAIPAAVAHTAPQAAAAADDDGCPHEPLGSAAHGEASNSAHHDGSGHESHDQPEHAAHGTFCSFCLTASSVVALLSAQPATLQIVPAAPALRAEPEEQRGAAALALHRTRGPPALSR